MDGIAKACVGLAAVGFLAAVATAFMGPIMGISGEAFSRASTNLALIALCLFLGFSEGGGGNA